MTTKTKTKTSITPAQARALRKWIASHGHGWKSRLREAWETGRYPPLHNAAELQFLRNTRGPSWLARYRVVHVVASHGCETVCQRPVKDTDEGDRLDLVTCPICYEDSASLRGGQP